MSSALTNPCNIRFVPLLLLLTLGFCGCGGTGRVSGTVTKYGEPVKSGMITFVSKEGKGTALASIKKNGTYTALNVPVGETVVILVNAAEETAIVRPTNLAEITKRASQPVAAKLPTMIPDKFAKPETSGLTLTVHSGDNHFDIDVGK